MLESSTTYILSPEFMTDFTTLTKGRRCLRFMKTVARLELHENYDILVIFGGGRFFLHHFLRDLARDLILEWNREL